MRSLLIFTLLPIFVAFALKNRFYGALLYWWFAIFRPQDWIWINVDSLRLPLIVAAIFIIPCFLKGIFPKISHPIFALMAILLLLEFIAFSLEGCGSFSSKQMEHLVKLVLIVMLTERVLQSKKQLYWLVTIAGFSLCFHSADLGLYSLKQGGTTFYDTASLTGSFSGSNALALGTATLVFFLVIAIQCGRNKEDQLLLPTINTPAKTMLYTLSLAILIIGSIYLIVAIESRGSALALAAAICLWIFLQTNRVKIISIAIPLAIVTALLVPLPEGYDERISSVFAEKEEKDKSAESRPYFWNIAAMIASDYTFGVGPGCYRKHYDKYDTTSGHFGISRSVHSSHFQILAETGYLGLACWLTMIFAIYLQLYKIRKYALLKISEGNNQNFYLHLSNGIICALTTFILGGSFYELAHIELIWLIASITVAAARLQKQPKLTQGNANAS